MAMPMRSEEPEPGREMQMVSAAKPRGGVAGFLKAEKSLALSALVMAANMALERLGIAHSLPALSYFLEACVFAAILFAAWGVVARAELLAEKYGEPYGTMILTFSAITVEVIMIATMMLHGDRDPTVTRDTMYATLLIILNGFVGLAVITGGLRFGEQRYNFRLFDK